MEVFRQTSDDVETEQDVHLSPITHSACLSSPIEQRPETNLLRVSVLGIPNAGKSTLINQLVGSNVCAYSQKSHTTRTTARAILTQQNTQIVFADTPGVVKLEDAQKFHLEDSLVSQPAHAAVESDLLLVIQDVSSRFVREAIDKRILKLLCYHSAATGTPAILVLNKIDLLSKERPLYKLIRKLTCGHLEGVAQAQPGKNQLEHVKVSADTYLKRKLKEEQKVVIKDEVDDADVIRIRSYSDFLGVLKNNLLTDSLVTQLTNGLVGWPGFKEVFAVSALEGLGVEDLRKYLCQLAYKAPWDFHPDLKTDVDPRQLVLRVVKSKLLEILPSDVPYAIEPVISSWLVKDGVLRLNVQINSNKPRTTRMLLYHKAANLSSIAKLAEYDLQNFFGREVFVMLSVNVTHKPKPNDDHYFTENQRNKDVYL